MITDIPGVKLGIWIFAILEKVLRNATKTTSK
jgi:hypothetical protein